MYPRRFNSFHVFNVIAAKQIMRKEMKTIINGISKESREAQSRKITDKLFELPHFKSSSRIGVYLHMNEEVRTDRIVEHIFECGKQCFVPWFKKDEMKLIKLISLEDYISLPRNKWNIAQPITVDDREDALSSDGLDLVLVPGLAFTLKGDRLGRGKGYYDRFLFSMSERRQQNGKPFQAIALSFKEQIVDNMPVTPKDFTVHSILYDER